MDGDSHRYGEPTACLKLALVSCNLRRKVIGKPTDAKVQNKIKIGKTERESEALATASVQS